MKLIDPKAKSNLLYVSQEAFDQMQQIPTVDAEPVVRCCDCKHMRCFSIGRQWCDMWEKELFILDGFCFYGNREVDNPRCRYYPSEDGFRHYGKQKENADK